MTTLKKTEDEYLTRIDELISSAENLIQKRSEYGHVDNAGFSEWRISCKSLFINLPMSNNHYLRDFEALVKNQLADETETGLGILRGLKSGIEQGFMKKNIELVKAEVFTDFLDIGEHLLENDYKDPAASLIGAVLEIELRNLCTRNDIPFKSSDDISCLNGKLKDKEVYHQPMRSQIEAWKKIRDKADHGHFDEYTIDQVKDFLSGVRKFIGEYLG